MRNSWLTYMSLALLLAGCSQAQRQEVKAAPASAAPRPIAAATPTGDLVSVPEVRKALQQLDIWLEGRRLKDDLTSISVGVVHDQQLIWSKGYGYADVVKKIPATDQTLYRVASLTKLFTSTAVMQQVERGRLSLEDPVSEHLKWFAPRDADLVLTLNFRNTHFFWVFKDQRTDPHDPAVSHMNR